jgi:hypothetical protein
MPSLVVFFQYYLNEPIIRMNESIHTDILLEKAIYLFSLFLFFFKLGLRTARNSKAICLRGVLILKNRYLNIFYLLILLYLLSLQRPSETIYGGFKYGVDKFYGAIPVNVIPVVFFIMLLLFVTKTIAKKNKIDYWVFLLFYGIGAVYYNFLMGYRVEALGFTIAFYFLILNVLRKRDVRILTISMILLLGFLWTLGFTRYGGVLTVDRILSSFSTFSDIANSYLIAVDMIDNNPSYDLKWFDFLFDNIKSTLPEVISPIARPIPTATFISISEYSSVGGIYWFGSIYLSFGIFGIFYTYIVGYLFGFLGNYRGVPGSLGNYMFLITIMFSFRMFYYGGLSLYKGFIILFLLLLTLKSIEIILSQRAR